MYAYINMPIHLHIYIYIQKEGFLRVLVEYGAIKGYIGLFWGGPLKGL